MANVNLVSVIKESHLDSAECRGRIKISRPFSFLSANLVV